MKVQQCVIDLAIVLITIPSLVIVALLLEYLMSHTGWTDKLETQIIVLVLSVAFFLICIMISIYLTHRLGNCLWAGPQSAEPTIYTVECGHTGLPPPTYDTVMSDYEPPPYEKLERIFAEDPPPSYAASVASLSSANI